MRFSIIIPVYNVEKYIRKCLESVENQTYKNYEVIIVNDGTEDNSQEIIDEFVNRNPDVFKSYIKENTGLADTRNYAVQKARGEYIFFLDSDDYIDINLLEKVNEKIEKIPELDMIKISSKRVDENDVELEKEFFDEKEFSGEELFIYLRKRKICIEPACFYIIKTKYWIENKFSFPKGKLHEDFATMLVVLLNAKRVCTINECYYNYVVRENSIMTNTSYEKQMKKVRDILEHYDNISQELNKFIDVSEKGKEACLEYISTSVCVGIKKVKGKDKKEYKKEIRKRKVLKNFKCDSLRNALRKIVFSFMVYI